MLVQRSMASVATRTKATATAPGVGSIPVVSLAEARDKAIANRAVTAGRGRRPARQHGPDTL